MNLDIACSILIWCLAVVLLIWQFVPPLAHLFGYFAYTYEVQAESETFRKEPTPAWVASTEKRLADLGFQRLARTCLCIRFDGVRWRKNIPLRLYASEGILVTAHQSLPFEAPRIAMLSLFSGDAVLATASSLPSLEIREMKYWRSGLTTNDPLVLLNAHRRRMLGPLEKGAVLVDAVGLDVARKVNRVEFETVYVQSNFGALAAMQLFLLLVLLVGTGVFVFEQRSWLTGGVYFSIAMSTPFMIRIFGKTRLTLASWLTRWRYVEPKKEPSPTDHLIQRERAAS